MANTRILILFLAAIISGISSAPTSKKEIRDLLDLIKLVKKGKSQTVVNSEESIIDLSNQKTLKKRGQDVFECDASSGYYKTFTISNAAEGFVQSSNYGRGNYNDLSKCTWVITVRDNKNVRLVFDNDFELEQKDASSCYDYVTVSKGARSDGSYDRMFCGSTKPADVYISGSTFTIVFNADSSTAEKGFKVRFVSVNSEQEQVNNGNQAHPNSGINNNGCGTTRFDKRIMNGEQSAHGEWPWMAHIKVVFSPTAVFQCGASLIKDQWLVTAAHCLESGSQRMTNPSGVKIYLAEHNTGSNDWTQFQVTASKIIIHSQRTRPGVAPNDIALIKLTNAVSSTHYVNPVCLPESRGQFYPGMRCVVAGWGRTHHTATASEELLHLDMDIIAPQTCKDYYGPVVTPDVMCAIRDKSMTQLASSCKGDSGGPLMCEINNKYYLAGVVQFGSPCGQEVRPLPAGFASIDFFMQWIDDTIAAN